MTSDTDELRAVPAAWPALLALAAVVVLDVGMVGFDFYSGSQTHASTNYMVDNSVASLVKVGDLRYQAARLLAAHDPAEVGAIVAQIDADL
jgi:hypothetical protein